MNERDKELALQAWTENDWDEYVDIPKLIQLVRADERERFYGQDKPAECANGCPANQICDYCQIVEPVKKMIADEREACALICDEHADDPVYCGAAIRARETHERRKCELS